MPPSTADNPKTGVTCCKPGRYGASDKFCAPIQKAIASDGRPFSFSHSDRPRTKGRPAGRDARSPSARGDHVGQRYGQGQRRHLFPSHGRSGGHRARLQLHGGDIPNRADHPTGRARTIEPRRTPGEPRPNQRTIAVDHRWPDGALGHQGGRRRAQGRAARRPQNPKTPKPQNPITL